VLGAAGGGFQGVTELQPFSGQAAPTLREGERGLPFDVGELTDRYSAVVGRIYAWGPKSGDWDTLGRWQVKWLSPFSGWPDARGTLATMPPPMVVDFTRAASPYGYYGYGGYKGLFHIVAGDDPAHALLIGRRQLRNNEIVLFELEADRAPVELRRADGEPFGEIEAFARAAGRWFFATSVAATKAPPATVIWQVDGAVARELARVPRAGLGEGGRAAGSKIARRSDGRAIGLVVDGQATAERPTPVRWVIPVDLESGQLGEPESLGYTDFAGRTVEACTDDLVGWVIDTPVILGSAGSASIRVRLPQGSGSIHSVSARMRVTGARACVERIAGTYDGQSPERAAQLSRPGGSLRGTPNLRPGELLATAVSAQTRYALKCSLQK
jgi:hypothetical protein